MDVTDAGDAGVECTAGQVRLADGSCAEPGVRDCGSGFEPDGRGGCDPILPSELCPAGSMAVPGETACRPVAPCGDGPWGDIPVEADSQHVDAAYGGGNSDGSAERPWTTIPDALDAAPDGAIVALAAGTYSGMVTLRRPVRLWGRCPEQVTLDAPSSDRVLELISSASGTVVRGLALTGATVGIVVHGDVDAELDQLWVHDTAERGVNVELASGAGTVVSLSNSLIEDAGMAPVVVLGAQLDLDRVVVRGSHQLGQSTAVWGIYVHYGPDSRDRSGVTMTDTVVEDAHQSIHVIDSDIVIDRCVVRHARSPLLDSETIGVRIEHELDGPGRSTGIIRRTVIQDGPGLDLFVGSADATIEDTTIRDRCLRANEAGFNGSSVDVVRAYQVPVPANAAIRFSTMEHCANYGLTVVNSTIELTGTVVRLAPGGLDQEQALGCGMLVAGQAPLRATMMAHGCLIEDNRHTGLVAGGTDATLDSVIVRNTSATPAGSYGDGIAAMVGELSSSSLLDTVVTVTESRIESNARAGLSSFGASLDVGSTAFECNRIDIDGEEGLQGQPFAFDDLGANTCACDGTERECQLVTTGLEPPSL